MKKLAFFFLFALCGSILYSQTIELPGTGSNEIKISKSLINSKTQFIFGNIEYNVMAFKIKMATSNNPTFYAASNNNLFTEEMLKNIPLLILGNNIELEVTLKAPKSENSWNKSYVIHLIEE